MANTPEASGYTSIKARLHGDPSAALAEAASRMLGNGELNHFELPLRPLLGFSSRDAVTGYAGQTATTLPMYERDYLQLVDTTGRYVARGKRGRIDHSLAPILDRLGFSTEDWIHASTAFRRLYRNGDLRLKQSA